MSVVLTRRVLFISRDRVEQMHPGPKTALISISDPDRRQARLRSGWHAVFRLAFDDLDPDTFPIDFESDPDADDFAPMTIGQAVETASFVRERTRDSKTLVVHCRYGVSRSAGAAKAIAEYIGATYPWQYEGYNAYVYRLIKDALKSL